MNVSRVNVEDLFVTSGLTFVFGLLLGKDLCCCWCLLEKNQQDTAGRSTLIIRELKQTPLRRKRERHLKMQFQLFKVIMLEKFVLTILELYWNQRLGHNTTKTEHLSTYSHVVQATAKEVISRRRKNENVFKMSKDEKCTCKACKNTVFTLSNMQICGVFVAVVVVVAYVPYCLYFSPEVMV